MRYFVFTAALLLAACQPTIDSRGFNPDAVDLKSVKIGKDTKDSIQERFGSPSTTSTFPNQAGTHLTSWFYVSKRTSTTSFFSPEVLSQQTFEIQFNEKGIVTLVRDIKGDADLQVEPLEHKTKSTGYEDNAMRDIFGNFGRYSNKKPTAEKK